MYSAVLFTILFTAGYHGGFGQPIQKENNKIKAECSDWYCLAVYSPVCGTNGITYSNMCWLAHAQCKDSKVKLDYKGKCGESLEMK